MEAPLSDALLGQELEFVQRTLDSMADPIFVKDRQHRWIVFNHAFCQLLGRSHADMLGKSDPDFFPPDQVEEFWRLDDELFESGEPNENEEQLTDDSGALHWLWTRKYPIRDAGDEVVGLVGIISDITELRQRLDSVDSLEQQTREQQTRLDAQQELIDAMEAPIISLWEGILLVPLVGEVSEHRAERVLDALLREIAAQGTRVVFLDITGVPSVSAASATKLVETVAAARLLGARAEIVGVSPQIARTLVTEGVDLGSIRTHANLRDGLRKVI